MEFNVNAQLESMVHNVLHAKVQEYGMKIWKGVIVNSQRQFGVKVSVFVQKEDTEIIVSNALPQEYGKLKLQLVNAIFLH